MVLYYTGTGNSLHIAQRISHALGDTLFNMNERIKAQDFSPLEPCEKLIIVTPTYGWRIPRIVRSWLMKTALPESASVWFVMNCGSETGNAAKYNRELCHEKGLSYMGTAQIVMPENYIAMFNAPDKDEARQIVSRAEPVIDSRISDIAAGREFAAPRNNLYDRFMSAAVNPIFYKFFVKSKAFTVSGACVSCGKCAALCPVNGIEITDGKPVWNGECTHCMACICHCPADAIEYGRKSLGKPRYSFEKL